ncbi:MAG: replication restart helicase PriA, partial [Rubrivivax sp.]
MTPESVVPVVVDAPQHAGLGATLDYAAALPLPAGTLVQVPLGRRSVTGIVWPQRVGEPAAAAQLRPVQQAMLSLPPLGPAWMQLVAFSAGYYQRSLGELALSVLPPELRKLDDAQMGKRLERLRRLASAALPPAATPCLPALTDEQAHVEGVLAAVPLGDTTPTLLQGVTGSGKTEVYLRSAARALGQGRQVLVLVPEINLTPQLEARFAERFAGHRLVSLHSGLTPAQRLRHWLLAHLGHADLVLGTRLAVFASMPRLGLIVVDEEHDPSFKQQEGARYSARDLAIYRGRAEVLPVLLGSATPSLESWSRAEQGRYRRLSLTQRVGGGGLPTVRLLDMNTVPRPASGVPPALAPALQQAIEQRIARGEQSLLFLNRRGYAPVLFCGACGWKSGCPHCSAWRVFHKADRTLRCHHCGFTERVPRACPDCGNLDIAPVGRGTERMEEQIAQLLPQARVARIDADSTRVKGALQAQLTAMHAGEVDVLVGTQMIAKGHDFRGI